MMTREPRTLDGEQMRAVAALLVGAARDLLGPVASETALARLGWTAGQPQSARACAAELPYSIDAVGILSFADGELVRISAPLMDASTLVGPDWTSFRQDLFSAAAAVLTEVYGAPAERVPGRRPALHWRIAEFTLSLLLRPTGVVLVVEHTARREAAQELAARIDEGRID